MQDHKSGWWQRQAGGLELLRIAVPLVLTNSFWTLQVTIDRIFLSWYDSDAVGAAMAGAMFFWTPVILLQQTASYATTFVAQYYGAKRYDRVGPVIWQAIYFSILGGLLFLLVIPFTDDFVALGGHSARIQQLEADYFYCLTFAAMPTLLAAAISSFFAGRGDSWTVLWLNGVGFAVNALLDYAMIFGYGPIPEMGMAGAGWATVIGCWASVAVGCVLLFRRVYRQEFATLTGWRFDSELFGRLLRFGLPSGTQWSLEALAFTCFVLILGRIGEAELAATSIAFTINMTAFMPTLGIAQAVTILVGQRLGQNRSDLAARSTWTGFTLAWFYMTAVAAAYVLVPDLLSSIFQSKSTPEHWAEVAMIVRYLLIFVAVYSLFDSANLVFAFALKGAGDTRFVALVSLSLTWPIMVLPTYAAWYYEWGLYWAWGFASVYVIVVAVIFLWRFLQGRWQSMRVIETEVPEASTKVELQDVPVASS